MSKNEAWLFRKSLVVNKIMEQQLSSNETRLENALLKQQTLHYRKSLQFANFWGNENPRITKPRISRTPIFGSRCPLTLC